MFIVAGVAAMLFVLFVALQNRFIDAPDMLAKRIETQINDQISPLSTTFSNVEVALSDGINLKAKLSDIGFQNADGTDVGNIEALEIEFDGRGLINSRLTPKTLLLRGVFADVVRNEDGKFNFGLAAENSPHLSLNAAQISAALGSLKTLPILEHGENLIIENLHLDYDDQMIGQTHAFEQGRFELDLSGRNVAMSGDIKLQQTALDPVTIAVGLDTLNDSDLDVRLWFSDTDIAQIAAFFPARPVLKQVSGSVTMAATGFVRGAEFTKAEVNFSGQELGFRSAPLLDLAVHNLNGALSVDVAKDKITLTRMTASTSKGNFVLSGQALNVSQDAVIAQIDLETDDISNLAEFSEDQLSARVRADLKVMPDRRHAEIGSFSLDFADETLNGYGQIGWSDGAKSNVNISSDRINVAKMMPYWPVQFKPKMRNWFAQNIRSGDIIDLFFHASVAQGKLVQQAANFGFENGTINFMRSMPVMTGASGYGTLHDNEFHLALNQGSVQAGQGGVVRLGASSMVIGDVREKPAKARFQFNGNSTITAALSLLDRKPMQIMTKSNRPVTIADGRVAFNATVRTPLKKGVKPQEVSYNVTATARDVRSSKVVEGRKLVASKVNIKADNAGVEIKGPITLSGLSANGSWRKKTGAKDSQVLATLNLSPSKLEAFGVKLPKGMIRGETRADFVMNLREDRPPTFDLQSSLNGIKIAIPEVAWSKSAGRNATFRIKGTLGKSPDVSSFYLKAPGLVADGDLNLGSGGGLKSARFKSFEVGNWLKTDLTLTPTRPGRAPNIKLNGGYLDIRNLPPSQNGSSSAFSANLSRLRITSGLYLSNAVIRFPSGTSEAGDFNGRINGKSGIQGIVRPTRNGTEITIKSANAGAALRDAGLLDRANEGTLFLQLREIKGGFAGTAQIENIRVKKAPAIANLVSAISIVGVLEQMDGKGLMFTDVRSDFQLKNNQLTVQRASAIGPSLGISIDGFINTKQNTIDLQGVLSPFYLVNGLGAIFTRRGEGLIGFNFNLKGNAANPRVIVNPLSAFTPGMFREIFRRPPPKITP